MAVAPPSTKEQVGAALQTAGQYAGGSTVWTPQNAEELGLDASRGYVAKGTPTDAPQPPTPVEPKPPSMAPGLGTTGGGPPPVRQEAPLPPAPSQQSQQNGALPKGFIQDEGKEGKAGLLPKGFIPDEGKEEEKPLPKGFVPEEEGQKQAVPPPIAEKPAPVQAAAQPGAQPPQPPPQPPQLATPIPSGTGAGAPQGEPADPHSQIQALIASGKTPGEAQAAANGQPPKTLTGETPPPKPTPAPKTEQPQGEAVDWGKLGYDSFEQYQKFVNELGVHTVVRGPGTTATLTEKGQAPSSTEAAPSTTTQDEKPAVIGENRLYGTSTIFGLNYDRSIDPDDNGRGFFGGINTRNPNLRGVAVPVDVLEGIFGKFTRRNAQGGYDGLDTPEAKAIIAKIQSAHVELPDARGKMHKFPIVDIQGSLKGHPGKVLDLTYGAVKDLGFTDNHAVSYQIIGGDGKPYPIPETELTRGGDKDGGPAAGPAVGPGGPAGPWISVGGAPSGGAAAPEQFRAPSERGGGGAQPDYSPSESGAAPVSLAGLGGLLAGAATGALRGGQQATQPSEEKGPSPSDVVSRVLAAGGPPPAPGAAPVDLSTMKPANVLGVRTVGAPQLGLPAPPAAPGPAAPSPDPIVIKGLMKQGFTREQALAFAAKATVSKPGAAAIAGGASFRKPAQLPAPPAPPPAPSRQPPAAAKPQPPPPQPQAPPRPQPSVAGVAPRGSTVGVPNPPGGPSPDDPRVKKQKDNLTKGEHFVPGDDFHDQLLAGLPGGHGGRQRQILAQAEQAIAEKRPMHISYISAPEEAQKFPTRESRTIQYEAHSPEARLMGTTEGQLVGHSFIPVSVGISPSRKAGEPHQSYIQGLSTNVIANNFAHLNTKLAAMGRKTPYARFGPKFANDLEGYLHNLNAGHTGTGRGYALGTAEYPNEPDTSHVPYKLTRHEADFLNAVINNTGAFAKHEDAQALRELARVNGTLITPQGETNRLLHEIEQHDPGWSGRGSGQRGRVLEPSIRSFKTGLIHEIHPSEEHLPATIRPGQEYRDLTAAMQRTSERGRPDVPVSISLHHTFADNKAINQIERDFSEERISEADARARLHALGEDPDQYRFVGGSGGLITPYEENPEAITPEEHSQLKDNLRKQWIGGKMPIEDYRRKAAEVPLPEIPKRTPPATSESPEDQPVAPPKPKPLKPAPPTEPEETEETEPAATPPAPVKQRGFKPYKEPPSAPSAPAKTPEPAAPVEEPMASKAPSAGPPPAPTAPAKAKPITPEPPEKLTKPKDWENASEDVRQRYLEEKVRQTLANQVKDKATHPLVVQRNEAGGIKYDPNLSPVYEQHDYGIADSPLLKKKRLSQLQGADEHEDTLDPEQHTHLNQVERKRLSALRSKSAIHTMGDKIVDSYNSIKDVPEIAAGKGWYSRMREKLANALGGDHEIFAQLLGATSAKTPVRNNFINALDAYEQWKEGMKDPTNMNLGFNRHIAKYLEAHGKMMEGPGALTQYMRDQGILKAGDEDHKSDADAMAHWIEHHDILPLTKTGSKYSANSNAVLKVLAGTWLKEAGAPKTPNFAGNLTGRTLEATIDVWAARHLQRLGYEGHMKGPWRAQSRAEPGVNNLDFAFSQDAMRHAADKLGINPDDLQAILWFAEKHHYEDRGWTRGQGAEKSSFDDVADKVFGKTGQPMDKPMSSEDLRAHYAAEAKAKQQRQGKIKTARTYVGATAHKLEPYMAKHGLTHEEVHGAPQEEEEAA
jgi:hypothetical protein